MTARKWPHGMGNCLARVAEGGKVDPIMKPISEVKSEAVRVCRSLAAAEDPSPRRFKMQRLPRPWYWFFTFWCQKWTSAQMVEVKPNALRGPEVNPDYVNAPPYVWEMSWCPHGIPHRYACEDCDKV